MNSAWLELVSGFGHSFLANPRVPLGSRVLHLGRAPDSDLVLADETVSWHHASIGLERGAVRVRDLGSTNGTWIDDRRVEGEAEIRPGQTLKLGRNTVLRVGSASAEPSPSGRAWRMEVLETGAALAVPGIGLTVGHGPDVDLSVPLVGIRAFTVRPAPGGAEIAEDGGPPRIVKAGAPFAVGGLHLKLLPADGPPVRTEGETSPTDRYRLEVTLDAPGPEAVLTDPDRGLSHRVAAENRAILLYLLASRLLDDAAARVPSARQGWCTDEELAVGIWGRDSAKMEANNLHVLLHRLRKELQDAGFDPEFLEKKSRALRARLVHVVRR